MQWKKITDGLPTDSGKSKKQYLFAHWNELNQIFISEYAGTWQDVQDFRKYDLENTYTHYIALPKIK